MKLRNMTMLLEKFNFVNGEMDYEKMLNSEEIIENFKFRHSQFDPSWESRIKPEDLITYQGNFSLRENDWFKSKLSKFSSIEYLAASDGKQGWAQ